MGESNKPQTCKEQEGKGGEYKDVQKIKDLPPVLRRKKENREEVRLGGKKKKPQ